MVLEISDYKKGYGEKPILELSDFKLEHGIYWIKGENGVGKSTLFKSIGGIVPFEGNIAFNNLSCKNDQKEYRKLVSYSEAEPVYPDFLTQHDLITFYAQTRKAGKEQIEYLMEKLGTYSYLKQPVKTFSAGMLKKLGLLLSLLGNPKLIILDEPFITVDSRSTEVLVSLIKEYHTNGATFLLSSHVTEGGSKLPITSYYSIEDKMLVEV